jgi:hypothetical protein
MALTVFAFGCGDVELPDEELTATGVVMDPDGGRVNGATVMIIDAHTNKQAVIGRTDSNGRFAIQIAPGDYTAYARASRQEGSVTRKLEGMTEPFTITANGVIPRMTIQLYTIVQIRTMCELKAEEIEAHADKKELIVFFSAQKFRELGIKEEQIVKITNLSTRQDIVVYAFQSDSILCEVSLPPVVVQKLLSPFGRGSSTQPSDVISVSLEVSIAAPELFR